MERTNKQQRQNTTIMSKNGKKMKLMIGDKEVGDISDIQLNIDHLVKKSEGWDKILEGTKTYSMKFEAYPELMTGDLYANGLKIIENVTLKGGENYEVYKDVEGWKIKEAEQ